MAGVDGINAAETVLIAQRKYADLKHRQSQIGLTIPEAFVHGIRHIGYRSNVDAIAELIDNSIQAYSQRVDLVFGYDGSVSLKKPSQPAVVDDGHGMAPEMLRLAMMWGGTHRENDRAGLGRYGFPRLDEQDSRPSSTSISDGLSLRMAFWNNRGHREARPS